MTVKRKRGRAGVEQRRRRLKLFPLCAECEKRGLVVATAFIDHIKPLEQGGTDEDDNVQGLCAMCHAIKTAAEGSGHDGAANHPDWLKPSAVPLEIVAGPPCAGKTTYVDGKAQDGDVVICLDRILSALEPRYRHWSGGLDPALFNKAIRVRNAMLGGLSAQRSGRAFFIVSAPTAAERRWWQGKLGGEVVLLMSPWDVLKRRAAARGTPGAVAGVDSWRKASVLTWTPPRARLKKVGCGADGYPLEVL